MVVEDVVLLVEEALEEAEAAIEVDLEEVDLVEEEASEEEAAADLAEVEALEEEVVADSAEVEDSEEEEDKIESRIFFERRCVLFVGKLRKNLDKKKG